MFDTYIQRLKPVTADEIDIDSVISAARQDMGVAPANPNQLYNGSSDEVFYYFAQHKTMVELNRIHRESNHAERKNRPLLILGYHPENN